MFLEWDKRKGGLRRCRVVVRQRWRLVDGRRVKCPLHRVVICSLGSIRWPPSAEDWERYLASAAAKLARLDNRISREDRERLLAVLAGTHRFAVDPIGIADTGPAVVAQLRVGPDKENWVIGLDGYKWIPWPGDYREKQAADRIVQAARTRPVGTDEGVHEPLDDDNHIAAAITALENGNAKGGLHHLTECSKEGWRSFAAMPRPPCPGFDAEFARRYSAFGIDDAALPFDPDSIVPSGLLGFIRNSFNW